MWFDSHEVHRVVILRDRESRMAVAQDWGSGGRDWELVFHRDRVSDWENEKVWRWMEGIVVQQREWTQCH